MNTDNFEKLFAELEDMKEVEESKEQLLFNFNIYGNNYI